MKEYKHINTSDSDIVIFDSGMGRHHLRPKETVWIDTKREGQGVVCLEERETKKKWVKGDKI